MLYELTKQETARLEKCLAAFNQYSGTSWDLNKYLKFMLADAIAEHEQIARNTQKVIAARRGAENVH